MYDSNFTFLEKYEIDNDLFECPIFLNEYEHLLNNHYQVYTIVDLKTGKPITYNSKLEFNPDIHGLESHFSKSVISQYAHNESNTLAYISSGVACYKFYLTKKYKFNSKLESKLMGILSNIIFLKTMTVTGKLLKSKGRANEIISKNEIYNILRILNRKSTVSLSEVIINQLAAYIWQKHTLNMLKPSVQKKMTIRTDDFLINFINSHPECVHFDVRQAIMYELNKIKSLPHTNYWDDIILNLKNKSKSLTYTQIVKILMEEHGLTKKAAEYKMNQFSKRYHLPPSIYSIYNNYMDEGNDTFSKINSFIDKFNSPFKLTQKLVSDNTDISLITVKRHWSKVKDKVNILNQNLKLNKTIKLC